MLQDTKWQAEVRAIVGIPYEMGGVCERGEGDINQWLRFRNHMFVDSPCANVQPAPVVLHQEEKVLRRGGAG